MASRLNAFVGRTITFGEASDADVRASTPTDAGKLIVPDVAEEQRRISLLRDRALRYVTTRIEREQDALRSLRARPVLATPERDIDRRSRDVGDLVARARRSLGAGLDRAADDVVRRGLGLRRGGRNRIPQRFHHRGQHRHRGGVDTGVVDRHLGGRRRFIIGAEPGDNVGDGRHLIVLGSMSDRLRRRVGIGNGCGALSQRRVVARNQRGG